MEPQLEKIFSTLKQTALTDNERAQILRALQSEIAQSHNPRFKKSTISPWYSFVFSRHVQVFALSLFIFISFGGTTMIASNSALPGDVLFSIKTGIGEKISRAFVGPSAVDKVSFETQVLDTRLQEAEELEEKNALVDGTKVQVKQEVSKQRARLDEVIIKLNEDSAVESKKQSMPEEIQVMQSSKMTPQFNTVVATTSDSKDVEKKETSPEREKIQNALKQVIHVLNKHKNILERIGEDVGERAE